MLWQNTAASADAAHFVITLYFLTLLMLPAPEPAFLFHQEKFAKEKV